MVAHHAITSPAMLIVCPSCASSYRIDPAALRPAGRAVRCARCKAVWQAAPDAEPAAAEAVERPGVVTAPIRDGLAPAHHDEAQASNPGAAGKMELSTYFVDEGAGTPGSKPPPDAPPLVPEIEPGDATDPATVAIAPAADNIETVAARANGHRPSRRRAFRLRPPRASTVALVLVATVAALVVWRSAVVRMLPQTATLFAAVHLPVNLRGLEFTNVTSSESTEQGVKVLLVEGKIVNVTHRVLEVPRLRFAMRNGSGREVYAWTMLPGSSTLAPDAALPFRTRLASPPDDGVDVAIRFFNKRDIPGEFH